MSEHDVFKMSEKIEQLTDKILELIEKHKEFQQLLTKMMKYINEQEDLVEREVLVQTAIEALLNTNIELGHGIAMLEAVKMKLMLRTVLESQRVTALIWQAIRNRERFK